MTENKNKKAKGSAIVRWLGGIGLFIERKIKSGIIGRILGNYTKANQALSKSFTASVIGRRSKLGSLSNKLRFIVAEQFEESRLLLLWRKLIGFFAGCRLRFYGAFFLTFGVYICLIYFLKLFFLNTPTPEISYIITASVLIVSAVPLVFSGQTFASKIKSSRSGHFIAVDVLGISEEKMNVTASRYGEIYNLAIFGGIAAGTLSYFINPLYILGFIFAMLVLALIISHPEIGVLFSVALIPFLTGNALSVLICLYCFSYLIKLVRGKRVLNFEIIDLAILFFALVLAFSTPLGENSAQDVKSLNWIIYILGAFVAGNLMRTKLWQIRCAAVTVVSGTVVSMIAILQKAAHFANLSHISNGLDAYVIFDGRDILSAYLIISLLFIYAGMFKSKGAKQSAILLVLSIITAVAILLTGSFPIVVGAIIASLLFFFIVTKKTFSAVILAGITAPCVFAYAQGFLKNRTNLFSFFDITSDVIYPMIKTWQGAMQLVVASMFGGVGVGGFKDFYPLYSAAGFETAQSPGTLWLRLLCDVGIVGFIIFALIVFLCIQNSFEYLSRSEKKGSVFVISCFSALLGLLTLSLFCDIFNNQSFFFAFWCLITILCAAIRTERAEREKSSSVILNSETFSSLDI